MKTWNIMKLSIVNDAAAFDSDLHELMERENALWRRSAQPLMPQVAEKKAGTNIGSYDIYPSFNIGNNNIFSGFRTLGDWIASKTYICIDGIVGNDWQAIRMHLSDYFNEKNIAINWYHTSSFLRQSEEITELVKPFVSEQGEVWGKRTSLEMREFFEEDISNFLPNETGVVHILIGTGAALADWPNLVYVELPKNEIQYRMRAGRSVSLAETKDFSNAEVYKYLYFVDWVINDKHRRKISDKIDIIADGQWRDNISWAFSKSIFTGLKNLSTCPIRVRPWFEAGAWGGQWLKGHIEALPKNEINYAWSFELIVPENGIVLESNGILLEVAFDWLMQKEALRVLGEDFKIFGEEFPIRFDYLDTVDGGNLSIQCHPSLEYIRKEFGENITQDETYYILDCKDDAHVYLGFQENIDPEKFKTELEESANKNIPINITDHVQVHAAKRHDLFLIPNQTIHSAGKNNLVLEISATPYIFTFKMYDWLRLDLDGNPRPINIDHAFKNLDFTRRGDKVIEELLSKPYILEAAGDYKLIHLPTHQEHFYDVHRIELSSSVKIETHNKCFVMMLVEGTSILIKSKDKKSHRFSYAETFIIPAVMEEFEIVNETNDPVKVIKAFIK